jgi:hypothetical protein
VGLLKGLGRAAKGLFGNPDAGDAFARAAAFANDDYASAARISQGMQASRADRAKSAAAAAERAALAVQIDSDPRLRPEDRAYFKADPSSYIKALGGQYESRQFGPAGGIIVTPGEGGRFNERLTAGTDSDGNQFLGVDNPTAARNPAREGVKYIQTPGFEPFAVSAFSGDRVPTKGGNGQRPVVTTKEQFDALPPGTPYIDRNGKPATKGGAGPQTPRGFR